MEQIEKSNLGIKNIMEQKGRNPKILIYFGVGLVLIGVILVAWYLLTRSNQMNSTNLGSGPQSTVAETVKTWQERGAAIAGLYADADVVADIEDGKYRIYFSAEPEVSDFKGQLYSATSPDGVNWTQENGIRKEWAIFPDVLKLPDGRWRLYYQNAGVIKSAVSTDGLNFVDEPGIRIDATESGYNLESVGAQSTAILPDGTYLMAYRGTINQKYQTAEQIPNTTTQLYFYATSTDGVAFTKKGIAIDSRNETLYGLADGGEWVNWSDNTNRLYFWSYKGVYHTLYENGTFSPPVFDFTNSKNSQVKFAPNPPSDPTLIKIDDVWRMYYGQHTKGIYYAEYK